MKNLVLKEFPYLLIVLIPFLYLAFIWSGLPEIIPIHWNIHGEIDGHGNKSMLIIVTALTSLLTYLILLFVPMIDPKKNINKMGKKFDDFKLIMVIFMSLLSLFIIHSSKNESIGNISYVFVLIGGLYMILGNYFKTIRPNYFIGIKTPWTLENEEVWKKTHVLAGKIWFPAGLIIIISSLLLSMETNLIVFIALSLIIAIVPIVYSYKYYQEAKM